MEDRKASARDTDFDSRYGVEEFAIIFPDTPLASARDAAARMLELVARREFVRGLRVTVSIGVAVYPHDGANATDLVARADNALYFAKKNGKNQVAMAGDLAPAGEARA